MIGLTATPKDEIDKNTYEVFELENGVPTYGYDLAQAVKDGYLVDYISVESNLSLLNRESCMMNYQKKIKEAYEKHLKMSMVNCQNAIGSAALNTWIFNEDTIKQV